MIADIKMQVLCKYLAQCFSVHRTTRGKSLPKALDFITTSYYELTSRPLHDPFRFVAAEPYMAGNFVKYSNNQGWVNSSATAAIDDHGADMATAFSHFTWEFTRGQIMVTDLQGVGGILTDPQIHTLPGPGRGHLGARQTGDLGEQGMVAFFASHNCTAYCRCLSLSPILPVDRASSAAASASDRAFARVDMASDVDLSCNLCGNIFACGHEKYHETVVGQKKQVYCQVCQDAMQGRLKIRCDACPKEFDVSNYWYVMIGMELPKTCVKCRNTGTAHKK